jgi:fused signal recognition particle receptor
MASDKDSLEPKRSGKLLARWRRKKVAVNSDASGESADEMLKINHSSSKAHQKDATNNYRSDESGGTTTESLRPIKSSGANKTNQRNVDLAAPVANLAVTDGVEAPAVLLAESAPESPRRPKLFGRALAKTGLGLEALLLGRRQLNEQLFEELETQLLMADVGVDVCREIMEKITARVERSELDNIEALRGALSEIMLEILEPCEKPLIVEGNRPFVILVIGVNGVGKTTTIGKLAHKFQSQGVSVMLAAGDTFRAAAVEQLQAWGKRCNVAVIAQHSGADSASVIYDALESASARQIQVLIADTAGRLHNKENLMTELAKIKRVMAKLHVDAPHEVLLVLDAGTGQNAIKQVEEFNQILAVTGLAITKLDGTAKGGVVLAIGKRYDIPIRYVGLGEGVDDIQNFNAEQYVKALLAPSRSDA